MNIQSNTNNLEMEFFYAHVDKAKTLEPFGLEMWNSGDLVKMTIAQPTVHLVASLRFIAL